MKLKYTKEQIENAVKNSASIAKSLEKLGVLPVGGNYKIIKKYIKLYEVDISHFTGQGWLRGQKPGPKRPIEDYLSNNYPIASYKLKDRIIKDGIKQHQCELCGNTKWLEEKIPLELHHIDGKHENNKLENLQLLCPNCHSMTDNYRGRALKLKGKFCKCGKQIRKNSNVCMSCRPQCKKPRKTKISWPSIEELVERLKHISKTKLAKELGVSDNAVNKRLKKMLVMSM